MDVSNQHEAFTTIYSDGVKYNDYRSKADMNIKKIDLAAAAAKKYVEEVLADRELYDFLNQPLKILLISETWCGDCAVNVPAISQLADKMDNWDYRISSRDKFDGIVSKFYLTGGRKSIPIVIIADENGNEFTRWIERPTRNYTVIAELQKLRLPKEEFIARYQSHPLIKTEETAKETIREIIEITKRIAAVNAIRPKKNKK